MSARRASALDAVVEALDGLDHPVREVLVGAHWTMVTTRASGLATTLRDRDPQHADSGTQVPEAGRLAGMSARDLIAYRAQAHPIATSIAMATVQSLVVPDLPACTDASAFDLLLDLGRDQEVAVVGHFPFVPRLREAVQRLWVLEQVPRPGDHAAEEAPAILPRCGVVCLTGTTLMNGTFEALAALCPEAFLVLAGPSAPLSPVLFDFGVDAICGSRVSDPERLRPYLLQGASFRQMHPHGVQRLTLERNPRRGSVPRSLE